MTPAHAKASGSMVASGSSWRDGSGGPSLKILSDTQRGWEPTPTASSCPKLVPSTPRRVTEEPGLAECFRQILPKRAPRTAWDQVLQPSSVPAPQICQGLGPTHFQTPTLPQLTCLTPQLPRAVLQGPMFCQPLSQKGHHWAWQPLCRYGQGAVCSEKAPHPRAPAS